MTTDYGSRLRAARKLAGFTQNDLSKATGIPQSTISTAERLGNGSSDSPVYARACGVDALWLATGKGDMRPSNVTADIHFSLGEQEQAPIVKSLQALDDHLQQLAPIFQDSARDALRKWALGHVSKDQAADALQAMALASESMKK